MKEVVGVIEISDIMEIIDRCKIKKSDNWINKKRLIDELSKLEAVRTNASTPNSLAKVIDMADRKIAKTEVRYVKTKQEIAELFSVTRSTLFRWEEERVLRISKTPNGYDTRDILKQLRRYNHRKMAKRI